MGIAVALLVLTMGIFALFRGEPSSQEKRATTGAERPSTPGKSEHRSTPAESAEAKRKAEASKNDSSLAM